MAKKKIAKKEKYPKGMLIRYNKKQEEEIEELKRRMDEKTATKAFLRCPQVLKVQHEQIENMKEVIQKQKAKIWELESIVEQWQIFTNKVSNFITEEGKNEKNRE
jgi:hypothetical protein